MGKSKAPEAPDPKETAAAATGTNIGTAIANGYLSNINQVTPDGKLTYSQSGTQKWTDPNSGKVYDIPITTATQTLSKTQQGIKNLNDSTSTNLATLARDQSGRLNNVLSTPFGLGGAPAAGNAASLTMPQYQQFGAGPQLQTSIGSTGTIQNQISDAGKVNGQIANAGNIQTALGNAGDITRTYGTDYGSNVKEVQDALMSRINPSLEKDRTALETRLANQGIQLGSAAYESAMKNYGQQANDARYGAILNAGQEQSRLASLEAQRAGFENSAQQQDYTQKMGSGQFANAAQAQQYSQNANDAQFGNAAQAQQFGQNSAQQQANNAAQAQGYEQSVTGAQFGNAALQQGYQNQNTAAGANNALQDQGFNAQQSMLNAQNAQRAQYLAEQYAQRNQNINEVTGLASGSQVTSPNFVPTQGQSLPSVDYAGLVQQNYANQMGAYQQQQAQSQSLIGGLFGLGSAFIKSDERTKTDIEKVGKVQGQNVYTYRYKSGGPMQLGVLAQEVEKDHPEAVREFGGIKHVNYGKLFQLGAAA